MRNKVSELMDGELDDASAARVIDAVKNDSDLFSDWEIYHVINDSLRQSAVNIDVSDYVRNQLADEPLLLSPHPHKNHQNRKQRLLGLSVAASVAALSVGWLLISQSIEQHETTLQEVYMVEKNSGKAAPLGNRSLMTFQPMPAYSSSVPVSTHYSNDSFIYRDLIYERSIRYPVAGISAPAEAGGEQSSVAVPAE